MKTKLIQPYQAATCLLVYFAGWGTPTALVRPLILPEGTDLLICYDYQSLELPFNWHNYRHIDLVAWSMGVWVAERVMGGIALRRSVAMNGTGLPMHDQYGIPQAIFQATLEQLTPASKQKFDRRMCGSLEHYRHYQQTPPRAFDQVKRELAWLKQQLELDPRFGLIRWDKAIIGEQDKIFPVANMLGYWRDRTLIEPCPMPHYPFAHFQNWEQVLC